MYDGIGKHWTWDNLDLRAVAATEIRGTKVVFGSSFNNSPGVQDPWKTLLAWGFPYTTSALAPTPVTAPPIAGGLSQTTLGLTAYAWIDSKFYVEAGGYRSPAASLLSGLGADPFALGNIHGVATYIRLAMQQPVGRGVLEVRAFSLRASLFPGRDRSTGSTDRYTDIGVDTWYQLPRANGDLVTLNTGYTHEVETLRASYRLGGVSVIDAMLDDLRLDAFYYWRNAIGGTIGVFQTTGSADPLRFGGRTSRPRSNGSIVQLDGTPFGGGSPAGSWVNVRVGVQYTFYTSFDGARTDYDGAGTNASANNTLRFFLWLAF